MVMYIELGALLGALFVLYLLLQFLKDPLLILANSIAGFIAFILVNSYFHLGIAINIWSLLAVAFGGIAGFLMVLALHFLGMGF
ncbi:pro-sigmaK processing inhibitor BofA family protein [Candidatus Micrarchaeota archaeon]|nr:pro-sigmaK processing inhibitor BofA family protein [Candidatus Micrarchaeota archaeon]